MDWSLVARVGLSCVVDSHIFSIPQDTGSRAEKANHHQQSARQRQNYSIRRLTLQSMPACRSVGDPRFVNW
jgi:hypothetical protein